MLFFVTDEDFDRRIVRGLIRQKPDLELLRAEASGFSVQAMRSYWNGRRTIVVWSLHTIGGSMPVSLASDSTRVCTFREY